MGAPQPRGGRRACQAVSTHPLAAPVEVDAASRWVPATAAPAVSNSFGEALFECADLGLEALADLLLRFGLRVRAGRKLIEQRGGLWPRSGV